jgi:hypothetical protein
MVWTDEDQKELDEYWKRSKIKRPSSKRWLNKGRAIILYLYFLYLYIIFMSSSYEWKNT